MRRALWLAVPIFPFVAGPLAVQLANQIALAAIGALGLTLLTGTAGLLSLGSAALLGAGGFTVGVLSQEVGAPIWITLPAAVAVGALLGIVVGLPSLRLRGVYLAVSTLALHFVVTYLGSEYQSRRQLSSGIVIADPTLGPFTLSDPRAWFFVLLGVLALTVLASRSVLRARTGRAWMALRDRELAASSVGVDVAGYKLAAFVVSSATISLAGALGAYYQHFVAADGYTFFLTIQSIAMVLIGGVSSIGGALAGAAFVVLLPQLVNFTLGALPVPAQLKLYVFAIQYVLFGALMAGFILFEPGGLANLWRRLQRRSRTLRHVERPPMVPIAADALLDVSDLAVAYDRSAAAVDGLSLRVTHGSIVALLGANGAGKTTTLRAIGGILPTETARIVQGSIHFAGQSIVGWAPDRIARSGVILVPERDKIFGTLSVEQNLAVTRGEPAMRELIFGHFPILRQRRRVLAGYLSGGERQMLALACALLCRPRLLLVDELSLGLAPALVYELMDALASLREELGLTVLLVEQNAAAALAVADYAYVLANGRLVKQGPASVLRVDPDVQRVYLGMSRRAS